METMTTNPLPRFILARTDGEDANYEFAWWTASGPEDWDAAEASMDDLDPGESVEWAIYAVNPEPVSRRVFSGPKLEDDDDA